MCGKNTTAVPAQKLDSRRRNIATARAEYQAKPNPAVSAAALAHAQVEGLLRQLRQARALRSFLTITDALDADEVAQMLGAATRLQEEATKASAEAESHRRLADAGYFDDEPQAAVTAEPLSDW